MICPLKFLAAIPFRIFRRKQAFRLDNVANPFCKVIPRNGKPKFCISDRIVFAEIHAVRVVPCVVFTRSFHSRPIFVSQKLGEVLNFSRLGIFVQNALFSGRLLADDYCAAAAFGSNSCGRALT